jgi:hypothetical protein
MTIKSIWKAFKSVPQRKVWLAFGASLLIASVFGFTFAVWWSFTSTEVSSAELDITRTRAEKLKTEGEDLSRSINLIRNRMESEKDGLEDPRRRPSVETAAEARAELAEDEDKLTHLEMNAEYVNDELRRSIQDTERNSFRRYEVQEKARSAEILALIMVLPALGLLLFGYLRPFSDSGSVQAVNIKNVYNETSTDDDKLVRDAVVQDFRPDATLALEPSAVTGLHGPPVDSLFANVHARLTTEVQNLGRRGNINLIVGVLITVTATGLLVYMVTRPHDDFKTAAAVLSYYIPRVTTIALIETFAYFFLGLYKKDLAEIKYYQNERTTITALEIAWRASLWPDIGPTTGTVIEQIVKTDRNSSSGGTKGDADDSDENILAIVKTLAKIATDSVKAKD